MKKIRECTIASSPRTAIAAGAYKKKLLRRKMARRL
jgi:hypothetical protein